MRKWFIFGIILLATTPFALALPDSVTQNIIKIFVPAKEEAAAHTFVDDIRVGNFDPIIAATNPALKAQLTPKFMRAVHGIFGKTSARSVKIVSSRTTKGPNATTYEMAYEYELLDRWVIAEIVLQSVDNRAEIEGFHIIPLARSVEEQNAFTFAGKTARHVVFLF